MYNDGYENTIRQLFQELVLPMPKAFSDLLGKKTVKINYNATYYQERGKEKRAQKKANKYSKSSHTYKEVKKCGCKGGKNRPCSTKACGCRDNKNACNPACACQQRGCANGEIIETEDIQEQFVAALKLPRPGELSRKHDPPAKRRKKNKN
mmetsp:Transcript_8253/g.13082  ORF Transcript_8253/g.13082 Transcript_8253/m.13082 type:complete len:151 (-) Transcript_8253:60-512(-)